MWGQWYTLSPHNPATGPALLRLPRGSLTPDPGIKEAQGDPRRRTETGHFRAFRGLAHGGGVFQLRSMSL